MGTPRREMRDVVLVESGPDPTAGGAAADAATADAATGEPDIASAEAAAGLVARRRAGWIRNPRFGWAFGVAVTLVIVGTSAATDLRERARIRALADIPGFLAPIDRPVDEIWRIEGVAPVGLSGFRGHLLMVEHNLADGSVDVVSRDTTTGDDLWRVATRPERTAAATDAQLAGAHGGMDDATCAFPAPPGPKKAAAAGRLIACVVPDASVTVTDDDFGETVHTTKAHLLLLDAVTGATRSSEPVDPTTSVAFLGADLVTAHFDADGRVHVTRADPSSSTVRWTFVSPGPGGKDALGRNAVGLGVTGESIVISSVSNVTTKETANGLERTTEVSSFVLSADGKVIRTRTTDPATSGGYSGGTDLLLGGRFYAEQAPTPADAGSDGYATTLTNAATGAAFTVPGFPYGAYPDDGSLAELIFVQSDKEAAYDLASGRRRWVVPDTALNGGSSIVVDGRLIHLGADALASIDGRTGRVVWSTHLTRTDNRSVVTDGRLLLVTQLGPGGEMTLTAYGADDGRKRWQTKLADDLWLTVVDGRLYGWTGQGIIAFG